MAQLRIWKFRPLERREEEFASAYGADGVWSIMFGKARGYLGTTLYRPSNPGDRWLTIDRWDSFAAFEGFLGAFGDEYRALDSELKDVAGVEEFVGAFEEPD
jgi:heme-degrading monooxygenase HmoA